MKRIVGSLFVSVLLAGICVAQTAQSQAAGTASHDTSVSASQSGAQATSNTSAAASQATTASTTGNQMQAASASHLQAGSTMHAQLSKPLDARKNKPGDEVIAKTTQDVKSDGHLVIPRGSKLMGHVTEVKAQSKGQSGSALGVAFDRALLKNGTEIPVSLTVQAIGRGHAASAAGDNDMMASDATSGMGPSGAHASRGGLLNGVASTTGQVVNTAGSTAGAAVSTAGAASGSVASGSLSASSQGVVGLQGLSLSADSSNSTHGSVITSNGGNVHLDTGTEMILRVNQ